MTEFPDVSSGDAVCGRVNEILARVGDKWTVLVIGTLQKKPRRFSEIKRSIGGISQQMLTRTLKSLERDGMVTRTVHPTVPPQVEYALTDLGHSLSKPVRQLGLWVMEHIAVIEKHRKTFDKRKPPIAPSSAHSS
jgi:DNA-binding HxlR family transcriptional regulator